MALSVMSLALGYVLSTGALQAAPPPIKDPLGELESRRLTAEKSAKEIQTKSAEFARQPREVYEAAAKTHNAWPDAVCQRIEAGKGTDEALDARSPRRPVTPPSRGTRSEPRRWAKPFIRQPQASLTSTTCGSSRRQPRRC